MARRSEIVTAVEIGASKICAVAGRLLPDGQIQLEGFGAEEANVLDTAGFIENPTAAVRAIGLALQETAHLSGVVPDAIWTSVHANHAGGGVVKRSVPIHGGHVVREDVDRALELARAGCQPLTGDVAIHAMATEWSTDRAEGLRNPVGARASSLTVNAQVFTAAPGYMSMLSRTARLAGVRVRGHVVDTVAASYALLSPSDRERGCVLVDIGASSTKVSIWQHNVLQSHIVIGTGGANITGDIASWLRLARREAESVKRRHGHATVDQLGPNGDIETGLPNHPEVRYTPRGLATIIEPRILEILRHVVAQMRAHCPPSGPEAGVVLTGGGSLLDGLVPLVSSTVGVPVRLGMPEGLNGIREAIGQPKYATAVGVLAYALAPTTTCVDLTRFTLSRPRRLFDSLLRLIERFA